MSYNIAILGGTGQLGSGLALRWAAAGETVILGSRDPARAEKAAAGIRSRLDRPIQIEVDDYAGSTARADIVVLAVPFTAQLPAMKTIRKSLKDGAILVDTTVPLAATIGGSLTRTVSPWHGSAAQQIAELAPQGVPVVATFHTIAAGRLQDWPAPLESDVLITGGDPKAKSVVGKLIEKIPDLRCIDAGPLELARMTEQLTALLISIGKNYSAAGVGLRITGIDSTG